MKSSEIKSSLLTHTLYRLHFGASVTEYGGKGVTGIADVFGLNKSGYTHEFEVKVTKNDLASELSSIDYFLNPPTLLNPEKKNLNKAPKHGIYLGHSNNQPMWDTMSLRPNRFSFAVPMELKEFALTSLRQSPYGLYVVSIHENGDHPWEEVWCEKKASYLHKEKASPEVISNILRKACSEVEVLRRETKRGPICTKCYVSLPRRCEKCEQSIKHEKLYRKASNLCWKECENDMSKFSDCMKEKMKT